MCYGTVYIVDKWELESENYHFQGRILVPTLRKCTYNGYTGAISPHGTLGKNPERVWQGPNH